MRRFFSVTFLTLMCVPTLASASDAITRRDGFLMLWSALSRPADPWKKDAFADVTSNDAGYAPITYAHGRGFLDDTVGDGTNFRPNDTLIARDAMLWLVRTRNVALPDLLTPQSLSGTLAAHGLNLTKAVLDAPISADDLRKDMIALDQHLASEVVLASNYGEELQGETTAFGEIFDWHQMTAAHRTFPYNTLVRVTNPDTGLSVVVRINDRGPYVEGRSLDLSTGAFMAIAPESTGVIHVTMQRLGDATLVGPCMTEQRFARRVGSGVVLSPGLPHVLHLGETLKMHSRRWFVVHSVTYPDGTIQRFEDWVSPDEQYSLKPAIVGDYRFRIGSKDGRTSTMTMTVADCPAPVAQ